MPKRLNKSKQPISSNTRQPFKSSEREGKRGRGKVHVDANFRLISYYLRSIFYNNPRMKNKLTEEPKLA